MEYTLSGQFLEACDCTVICPCWVDDDPVGGHCTGFILWTLDDGSMIDDQPVGGSIVVSLSTHSGYRRDEDNTATVLYVDPSGEGAEAKTQKELLWKAFSGECDGTLGELAEVGGTVVGRLQAKIDLDDKDDPKGAWSVRVMEHVNNHKDPEHPLEAVRISASGHPKVFDKEEREALEHGAEAQPATMEHTALSHELQAKGAITVQAGEHLTVQVGALPGGNLEVSGRSGMRGSFSYHHVPDGDGAAAAAAAGPAQG